MADHFQVVHHLGTAQASVVSRCAQSQEGRTALKGHRHRFLRAGEDLEPEEEATRAQLAARFPDLGAAWQHKEALRRWYATSRRTDAATGLDTWMASVEREGPAELRTALSAFRTWRAEILACFDFFPERISTGFVEGKNNRTTALMRQAYGYRNYQHLRLRMLLEVA